MVNIYHLLYAILQYSMQPLVLLQVHAIYRYRHNRMYFYRGIETLYG